MSGEAATGPSVATGGPVLLPVRSGPAGRSAPAGPEVITFDSTDEVDGVPVCSGTLGAPAVSEARVRVRIYNRAGICLLVGEGHVAAGQVDFVVRGIRPLGVEAYAHRTAEQRAEMGRRVFARRSHATVELEAVG